MERLLDRVDRIFVAGVAASMAVIMVTVIVDVLRRYLLNSGLIFANELSRLGFVWMTFLVMPLGISRGLHVAIASVIANVPPAARRVMFRLGVALSAAFMAVVLAGAWISVGARASEPLNTLPITAQWFFWPLVIGAAWSLVHLTHQFLRGTPPVRDLAEQLKDLP
jgi:TRAP-type C4-dicarboxylate transport system permease small subunit